MSPTGPLFVPRSKNRPFFIWLSWGRWSSEHGRFFTLTRLYITWRDYWWWTPFVSVRKRYATWLGYWGRT